MKHIVLLFLAFLVYSGLNAKTYYIAPTGSDSNSGTINSPYFTITKAAGVAIGGDTIYMRGGIYMYTTPVSISKSGTASAMMQLWSYPGERAILDFSGTASGKVGITLSGSYWHIKGISVRLARDNGMHISGATAANNIIEFCEFYENMDSGLQIDAGATSNKIINCDSYYNADPTDYGDADGFAVKMAVGNYNYFYGCRSWLNVDDGWDGYLRGTDNVYTTIENCWTWKNGYFKDGTDAGVNANGNGFKMGGSDDKTLMHNFLVKNCLSFENKAKGFDQNNNKGNMTLYNCTGYNNLGNNFSVPSALNSGKACIVTNCAELGGKINLGSFVTQTTNSWQSPFSTTSADFISLISTEVTLPRQDDGSLPVISYMHLATGSDLIDGGTDVGIAFNGSKPDLGAWETGNYKVAITKTGNGLVFLSPAGGVYAPGTLVTIMALPLSGYTFSGFTGDLTANAITTQITVNSNLLINAGFTETTGVNKLLSTENFGWVRCYSASNKGVLNTEFELSESGKIQFSILKTNGQIIYTSSPIDYFKGAHGTNQLEVNLSSGIYFIVLKTSQKQVFSKFLVQ